MRGSIFIIVYCDGWIADIKQGGAAIKQHGSQLVFRLNPPISCNINDIK